MQIIKGSIISLLYCLMVIPLWSAQVQQVGITVKSPVQAAACDYVESTRKLIIERDLSENVHRVLKRIRPVFKVNDYMKVLDDQSFVRAVGIALFRPEFIKKGPNFREEIFKLKKLYEQDVVGITGENRKVILKVLQPIIQSYSFWDQCVQCGKIITKSQVVFYHDSCYCQKCVTSALPLNEE